MNLYLLALDTSNFSLGDGGVVALVGFCTVLILLGLIAIVISVAGKIIYAIEHFGEKTVIRKQKKTEATPAATVPKTTAAPAAAPVQAQNDSELIAVITAAIAASLNTSEDNLIVRSFKKSKTWQKEAIREQREHVTVI